MPERDDDLLQRPVPSSRVKANCHRGATAERSQEQNKAQALARLEELVAQASEVQAVRRPTRPTYGSKQRRLEGKAIRSEVKAQRGKVRD